MIRYIAARLVWGLVVLLAVGTVTFVIAFVVPGDPARAMAGIRASPEDVERIRLALGLDQPLLVQLGGYLARAASGDLGHSYHYRTEVLDLLLQRFPATLQLAAAGVAVALAVGLPLGVLAARRRGTTLDRLSSVATAVLVSVPAFWLGYILIYLLAFRPLMAWQVDLFPIGGYEPWSVRHLALPAITLGAGLAAYYARLTRNAMTDELAADYVRTARAKGLGERGVTWRHAFRNAAPLVLTQLGLDVGFLLGGVIIVEEVFGWPGIGRLAIDAITNVDTPLLMGSVVFATFWIVVANLVVDVAVAVLDPRIRRGSLQHG